jgi:hypothetical protein
VNQAHLEFCSSPEWARLVEDEDAALADRLKFSATSGR